MIAFIENETLYFVGSYLEWGLLGFAIYQIFYALIYFFKHKNWFFSFQKFDDISLWVGRILGLLYILLVASYLILTFAFSFPTSDGNELFTTLKHYLRHYEFLFYPLLFIGLSTMLFTQKRLKNFTLLRILSGLMAFFSLTPWPYYFDSAFFSEFISTSWEFNFSLRAFLFPFIIYIALCSVIYWVKKSSF